MPKRNRVRHFEPRYGVSQGAVDAEAKALSREVEDYLVLALNDLKVRQGRHEADVQHNWQQLQLLTAELGERERIVVQTLLFRDVYHLLQLYLTLLKSMVPSPSIPTAPPVNAVVTPPFSEWLFQPKGGKS